MRLLILLSMCLTIFVLPAESSAVEDQVLVVDPLHDVVGAGGRTPPSYKLKPGPAFVLDATTFDFKGKTPNSLQVALATDKKYSVAWPNEKRAVLSAATMMPHPGSVPFTAFESGQIAFIAIGYLDGSDFTVFWVAMVEVI